MAGTTPLGSIMSPLRKDKRAVLNAELVEQLRETAVKMQATLGFLPTVPQVITMINSYYRANEDGFRAFLTAGGGRE